MTGPIPVNTLVSVLGHNKKSGNIEDAIQGCINFTNENDGFTVVSWYSTGEINDQSLIGLDLREEV